LKWRQQQRRRRQRDARGPLIYDESESYVRWDEFKDNILPMLSNNNRALLAISTPAYDDGDWYRDLVEQLKQPEKS
jgi:hypothetical protein